MDKYKFRRYGFYLLVAVIAIAAIVYFNSQQKKTIKSIDGAELFKRNCAPCHKCDMEFVAPALKGSLLRWGNKKLMYAFVRNPGETAEKNNYAREVVKKYNNIRMTSFPTLSDKELDAIFKYCGD